MEQMEIYDLGLKDAKGKILKKTTDDINISKKCSQCEYASSVASNLRKHLKMHSGEKSNRCNQCDFASSYARSLKTHLKIHSGEKLNKCDQCDYASSWVRQFEETFENTQWRKVEQMQPMHYWLRCPVGLKRVQKCQK